MPTERGIGVRRRRRGAGHVSRDGLIASVRWPAKGSGWATPSGGDDPSTRLVGIYPCGPSAMVGSTFHLDRSALRTPSPLTPVRDLKSGEGQQSRRRRCHDSRPSRSTSCASPSSTRCASSGSRSSSPWAASESSPAAFGSSCSFCSPRIVREVRRTLRAASAGCASRVRRSSRACPGPCCPST